jgi:hypothetical protein
MAIPVNQTLRRFQALDRTSDLLQFTDPNGELLSYFDHTGAFIGSTPGDVTSVFGRSGVVVATSGDYSVAQITGAAPLASPTFTGTPHLPTGTVAVTQSPSNNSTAVATTAYSDAGDAAAEALALPIAKVRTYRSPSFTSLASATNSGAVVASFATPFADNNYTVNVSVEIGEASSYAAVTSIVSVASIQKQAAGAGVTVSIANADSITHTWSLNIVAVHD